MSHANRILNALRGSFYQMRRTDLQVPRLIRNLLIGDVEARVAGGAPETVGRMNRGLLLGDYTGPWPANEGLSRGPGDTGSLVRKHSGGVFRIA